MKRVRQILMLLALAATIASAQNDSPCNQGRAEPPRVDPRHPLLVCVPEIGRRNGVLSCRYGTEAYGSSVAPIGAITQRGLPAWVISRVRCDTTLPNNQDVEEIVLYRGENSMLPTVPSGERIGPREILSKTRFIASGDWDHSGTRDLCCYFRIHNDSSAGPNPEGYEYGYAVVFWSDSLGRYSIDDTTQLSCDNDRWGGVRAALGTDRNGDGIDDLMIADGGYGFSAGMLAQHAPVHIYFGHDGKRWGRDGASRSADWRWWNIPNVTSMLKETDQDGDGNLDIAWFGRSRVYAVVSVWYGDGKHGIPDTLDIESIDMTITNAHGANLMDISNDGVPELVGNCGSEEQLAIFVGRRGQRLKEQFGPGHESLDTARGERWWTKPFARVWLPNRINNAWPQSTWNVVYDLGDANNDGYRDIWIHAKPFLLCYTSGPYLDSLVDAIVNYSPAAALSSAQSLGRALGESGPLVFGIGLSNGIIYAHPDAMIPARTIDDIERRWPEGTLGPRAGIEEDAPHMKEELQRQMEVIPNPSSGDVELQWTPGMGAATLVITDLAGREVLHRSITSDADGYTLHHTGLAPGIYLATLRGTKGSCSARIVLR